VPRLDRGPPRPGRGGSYEQDWPAPARPSWPAAVLVGPEGRGAGATDVPSAQLIEDPFGCDPDDETQISRVLCCTPAGEATLAPAGGTPLPRKRPRSASLGTDQPARGHSPRGWSRMVAATAPNPEPALQRAEAIDKVASLGPTRETARKPPRPLSLFLQQWARGPRYAVDFEQALLRPGSSRHRESRSTIGWGCFWPLLFLCSQADSTAAGGWLFGRSDQAAAGGGPPGTRRSNSQQRTATTCPLLL